MSPVWLRLELADGVGATEPLATVAIPGGSVQILPGADLDIEDAGARVEQRRGELQSEIDRAERKLANQGFVAKAPEAVVQAERDKLARLREELNAL